MENFPFGWGALEEIDKGNKLAVVPPKISEGKLCGRTEPKVPRYIFRGKNIVLHFGFREKGGKIHVVGKIEKARKRHLGNFKSGDFFPCLKGENVKTREGGRGGKSVERTFFLFGEKFFPVAASLSSPEKRREKSAPTAFPQKNLSEDGS